MSKDAIESPYVSFTELLASAFLIFVIMIVYLALNQGQDERDRAGFLKDIESLQLQRSELAFTVVDALDEIEDIEAQRRDLQININALSTRAEQLAEETDQQGTILLQIQREAAEAKVGLETARIQLGKLQSENDELIGIQQVTEQELEQLSVKLRNGQFEIDAGAIELSKLAVEVGGLEDKRNELQRQLADLRVLIGDREAQSEELESRIAIQLGKVEEARQQSKVPDKPQNTQDEIDVAVSARLASQERARVAFLSTIGQQTAARGVAVQINADGYSLIIPNDIIFSSGSASLSSSQQIAAVKKIGVTLSVNLACNIPASAQRLCGARSRVLSTVLIEGHADTVGNDETNLDLSVRRSQAFLTEMLKQAPLLNDARSFQGGALTSLPLFGVAGYGEKRPRIKTGDGVPEARNRRIEIRFVFSNEVAP